MQDASFKTTRWENDIDSMRQVVNAGFCTCEIGLASGTESSQGQLESGTLGEVGAFRYTGTGTQRATRAADHIAADGDDYYVLYLPHAAQFEMHQDGRDMRIGPGMYAFVSTSRPFDGFEEPLHNRHAFSSTHLSIPAARLRERVPFIDDLCNVAQPLLPGSTRLMATVVGAIFEDGPSLSAHAAIGFGDSLIDLVAEAAEESLASEEPVALMTGSATFRRATEFIEANLTDPMLNALSVARACNVSVRALHLAFQPTGTTVAAHIRESRLMGCRKDVCDPRWVHETVANIALDWGFADPAHFSRLYKARFGIAPSRERPGVAGS
jgi:AraC family transcriptional regulator, positive regulator of tynA and feaB